MTKMYRQGRMKAAVRVPCCVKCVDRALPDTDLQQTTDRGSVQKQIGIHYHLKSVSHIEHETPDMHVHTLDPR